MNARPSSRTKMLLWLSPLFLLAGLVITYVVIQRGRFADQEREFLAHQPRWEPLWSSRFERPVLRGVARPCNAALEQNAALGRIDIAPWEPEDLSDDLGKLDAAPSTKAQAIIDRNHKALAALHRSATCSWSWSNDHELHRLYILGADVPLHRAVLKMLLAPTTSEPDTCLAMATDAMRLAQDRAAGTGMAGAMYTVSASKLVADVIERCAAGASVGAKKLTCADLDVLMGHRVHVGHAFLHETFFLHDHLVPLALMGKYRLVPTNGSELDDWLKADDAATTARALSDAAPKWLELAVIDDEDDVARVATIQDEVMRAATPNALEGLDLVAYAKRMTEASAHLQRAAASCR